MTDEILDRQVRDADPYRPDTAERLHGAEQSLLEEIMSEPARSFPRRLVGALAAAAADIAIIAGTAALRHQAAGPVTPDPSTGAPVPYSALVLEAAEDHPRLLIDQPGWKATTVYGFATETGTIAFHNGKHELEMNWYPAADYGGFREDRLHVSRPEPVQVDGLPADLYKYSDSDFAVMLRPRDEAFVEMRTGGPWTRAEFDAVLADIIRVDARTWLGALPPEIVTPDRVDEEAARLLAGVPLPPSFTIGSLDGIGTNDRYQFSAAITSRVGCAWIREWQRADKAGDLAARQRAADALRGSHRWKVLQDMAGDGGWAQVFWQIADQVAAGGPPKDYEQAIGCR